MTPDEYLALAAEAKRLYCLRNSVTLGSQGRMEAKDQLSDLAPQLAAAVEELVQENRRLECELAEMTNLYRSTAD